MSQVQAADLYGVIVDEVSETVDAPATVRKRKELGSARLYLKAMRGGEPKFHRGVRVAWVGDTIARRIGDGELAEAFVGGHPAPFRFSVAVGPRVHGDALELDREAWGDLGVEEGARLLVRRLWSPDC